MVQEIEVFYCGRYDVHSIHRNLERLKNCLDVCDSYMIIPPHSGPIKTISVIVNNQNIGKVQKRIKHLEFLEAPQLP